MSNGEFLDSQLSQKTGMCGLRVWVVIGIGVGGFTVLILLLLLSLRLSAVYCRGWWKFYSCKSKCILKLEHQVISTASNVNAMIPTVSKDIKEVVIIDSNNHTVPQSAPNEVEEGAPGCHELPAANVQVLESMDQAGHLLSCAASEVWDGEKEVVTFGYSMLDHELTPNFQTVISKPHSYAGTCRDVVRPAHNKYNMDVMNLQKPLIMLDGRHKLAAQDYSIATTEPEINKIEKAAVFYIAGKADQSIHAGIISASVHHAGRCAASSRLEAEVPAQLDQDQLARWGHRYSVAELEVATNQFAERNVVGEGGYGIVYQGLLPDGSIIAVKCLQNDTRGQAEKEFRGEVEAIGRVRHKNLVRLLGYCAQGSHRMLVYEYVDNGNLDQWLHGSKLGAKDPIPWDARMKIVLGTAKGLAYLHEDLEPKVVHRDIKSSNILLDGSWNAKVSDFGLAKLLGAGISHVTTRVMGTFGYVAPEYASTGLLTERSDVYSFGVLMMELITGRNPVDVSRPVGEVNLVDWMKMMVGSRRLEEMVDPRLKEKPSGRALKRALLVALRCVDPDSLKRPRIGHVVYMLEADDFSFHNVCRSNGGDGRRGAP